MGKENITFPNERLNRFPFAVFLSPLPQYTKGTKIIKIEEWGVKFHTQKIK